MTSVRLVRNWEFENGLELHELLEQIKSRLRSGDHLEGTAEFIWHRPGPYESNDITVHVRIDSNLDAIEQAVNRPIPPMTVGP